MSLQDRIDIYLQDRLETPQKERFERLITISPQLKCMLLLTTEIALALSVAASMRIATAEWLKFDKHTLSTLLSDKE